MYVYIHSEHSADHDLYTVGYYDPSGKFQTDSDHSTKEEAANRVIVLNGGKLPEPAPSPLPASVGEPDKGKWEIRKEKGKIYIVGERYLAEVFNYGNPDKVADQYKEAELELSKEAEANARLIASAPQLQEQNRVLVEALDKIKNWAEDCEQAVPLSIINSLTK